MGLLLRLGFSILLALAGCDPGGEVSPEEIAPLAPLRVLPQSGSLQRLVQRLPAIRDECKPVRFPSLGEIRISQQALLALMQGELQQAQELYAMLDFEVVELRQGEQRYWVARETAEDTRGWGLYVVNPRAQRPLILEAPHPQHDRFTGAIAARLLRITQATALIVATTHRCASKVPTRCDGRTGACRQVWGTGRYRRSDRAHITNSLFHAAHVALLDSDPAMVAIQVHGFARRPTRKRHVILSDGTRRPGGRSNHANRLARLMRKHLQRKHRRLVRSCNESSRQSYLCGTANVQGRHANGSSQPCRRTARRSWNRFVQIELSIDARTSGGLIDPTLLPMALLEAFAAKPR